MRPKVHVVNLTENQRQTLQQIVGTGRDSARKITRARILLKAADGIADAQIAQALDVGVSTVERTRRRFAAGELDAALHRKPQPPRPQ